jgi:hypothetical protein
VEPRQSWDQVVSHRCYPTSLTATAVYRRLRRIAATATS